MTFAILCIAFTVKGPIKHSSKLVRRKNVLEQNEVMIELELGLKAKSWEELPGMLLASSYSWQSSGTKTQRAGGGSYVHRI